MAAVTVSTSATLVYTAESNNGDEVLITNNSGATVYIGKDTTLTTSNGLALATGSSLGVNLKKGQFIYGIVAAATAELRAVGWY